jgi:hypothetical protein
LERKLPPESRADVQKISQLVAFKTLALTGLGNYRTSNEDLIEQISIIDRVARGSGYTSADDNLIDYFNGKYSSAENFLSGSRANEYLVRSMGTCDRRNCRAINNAIPNIDSLKDTMTRIVVCPTSSVCDGMGAFGSCVSPTEKTKEYRDMDFNITYDPAAAAPKAAKSAASAPEATNPNDGEPKYYQGSTNISGKSGKSVNVNYGFKFGELEIYNFLDINLESQPIILQANYTFKSVVNRIIEIWKSHTELSNIEQLWELLYRTDYFLSILKLGSQKAVGDIFQEINSSLDNGGYNIPTNINAIRTYGLMGDRPSGIRVIKLLKNGINGININACGGYIGESSSLIYVPNTIPDSLFYSPPAVTGSKKSTASTKKRGGSKKTNRKTNKKTQNKDKKINKKTNKNKRHKKHKKTQKK